MALFKKEGENLSRAAKIIGDITPNKEKDPPTEDPTEGDPPVEDPTEGDSARGDSAKDIKKKGDPTEGDPPVEDPPVEDTTEGKSGAADPTEGSTAGGDSAKDIKKKGEQDSPPIKPNVLTQPETKITDEAMFSYLSEKLNRKVESIEDLTIKEEKQLDPEIKQLLQWKEKTGLSLSKWSDYNKDFSKLTDMEVAREILAQEYPNLNKEELEYSLKDFIYDEDFDDETDKIKKSITLKKYAQDGRLQLKENQLKFISAEGNPITKQQETDLEAFSKIQTAQVNVKANQAKYLQDISQAAMSLEALNLKLSDDLTIKYDISEGDRKTLPKSINEMPHWYNKDGSINHANVVKDGLKIRDFDTIIKKAYEQGVDVGIESKIKTDNNITIDTPTLPSDSGEGKKKGNVDQVVETIAGNRAGPKLRFGKNKNN